MGRIADTGWPVTLRHGSVELRPIQLGDARELSRLRLRDREYLLVGEFRSPMPYRLANSAAMYVLRYPRVMRAARRGACLPWAVYHDGRLVGRYALFNIVNGEAENGGWIDSTMAGRGLYTTAKVLAVHHAFTAMGLRRVYAHVHTDNPASLRASQKVGFELEETFTRREGDGVRREWRRLALHAADCPHGVLHLLPPADTGQPPDPAVQG